METFDNFHLFPTLALRFALAIAIAIAAIRAGEFWRWFIVAKCCGLAYISFGQYFYLTSKGIVGDAFLLPGTIFALCPPVMITYLLASYLRKRRTKKNCVRHSQLMSSWR